MDTRMLDVAIGLVLVIAMLSLVVTTVRETLAGMMNSRGRNLARLVCSLVGDDKNLSERILAHPFLESMMLEKKPSEQRSPSYLSSDVFVTGMLAFFTKEIGGLRPASPEILVAELKTKLPQGGSQRLTDSLSALLPGVEGDWPAFEKRLQAWFDAVGERSIGWYKRTNQVWLFFIGLGLAAMININPIVIAKALWEDAALRKFAVAQAEVALKAYQADAGAEPAAARRSGTPDTTAVADRNRHMTDKALATVRVMLDGAGLSSDDALKGGHQDMALAAARSQQMRELLTLERAAAGIDSKRTQYYDAIAGFDLRLEQLRELFPEHGAADAKCADTKFLTCATTKRLGRAIGDLSTAIDRERGIQQVLSGDSAAAAILSRRCKALQDEMSAEWALCTQLKQLGIFDQPRLPIGFSDATWPRVFGRCDSSTSRTDDEYARTAGNATTAGSVPKPPANAKANGGRTASDAREASETVDGCPSWQLKTAADFGNAGMVLAGWILTAFGAMLGAPFWFDLLGKLVKLRNSGVKPDEANGAGAKAAAEPASTLTQGTQDAESIDRAASADALNDAEQLLSEDEITRLQRNLDMPATRQTGRLDLATRTAVSEWQTRHGVAATGTLTQAQIQELLRDPLVMKDDGYVG